MVHSYGLDATIATIGLLTTFRAIVGCEVVSPRLSNLTTTNALLLDLKEKKRPNFGLTLKVLRDTSINGTKVILRGIFKREDWGSSPIS